MRLAENIVVMAPAVADIKEYHGSLDFRDLLVIGILHHNSHALQLARLYMIETEKKNHTRFGSSHDLLQSIERTRGAETWNPEGLGSQNLHKLLQALRQVDCDNAAELLNVVKKLGPPPTNLKSADDITNWVTENLPSISAQLDQNGPSSRITECLGISEQAQAATGTHQNSYFTQNDISGFNRFQSHIADDLAACLRTLAVTDPEADRDRIEGTKDRLLNGCYEWVFENEQFYNWEKEDGYKLLWINGAPGKGKTMLMVAIAKKYSARELLTYFFCEKENNILRNATSVVRSLIWMLIRQCPCLSDHVLEEYRVFGNALFEDHNALHKCLAILAKILSDRELTQKVYVMVDGLDECDIEQRKLLDFIKENASDPNSKAKWLVSSRPEPSIRDLLKPENELKMLDLELNNTHISRAVGAFIEHKVDELAQMKNYTENQILGVRHLLFEKAQSTFLWVSLVCKELMAVEAFNALQVLERMPSGLTELYMRMMEDIRRLDTDESGYCGRVLATVILSFRPLHILELRDTSGLPKDVFTSSQQVDTLIRKCGQFLTVQENIVYIVHQSAKDFLSQSEQALILPDGIARMHYAILSRSILIMSHTLKKDIYNLQRPGISIKDATPPTPDPLTSIRYLCTFWIDHLVSCVERQVDDGKNDEDHLGDQGQVHNFLLAHLSHWFEALSLLGELDKAMSGLLALRRLIEHSTASRLNNILSMVPRFLNLKQTKSRFLMSPSLLDLVHDAIRLFGHFRPIIEQAPLQVYSSAVLFSPENSLVRQIWLKEAPSWIRDLPGTHRDWAPCSHVLEEHINAVSAVAFSPDGHWLVSGSDDKSLRLWDPNDGKPLKILKGHKSPVTSVAFSPDGLQLVSGSKDGTLRFWDPKTGKGWRTLHTPKTGFRFGRGASTTLEKKGCFRSLAFSPDGQKLVSASSDRTIRLWDSKTGKLLKTLKGHTTSIMSVACSPDGQRLASGSSCGTLKLWDFKNCKILQNISLRTRITSISFSPNGRWLAVAGFSHRGCLHLLDPNTGKILKILKGHAASVRSVLFSPDSQLLVSGSDDTTVRLWNPKTGKTLQVLQGHMSYITSLAFSSDSQKLASASHDTTLRLWNPKDGKTSKISQSHTSDVVSFAFSPDGQRLASASWDHTIRIWDPMNGKTLQVLHGHMGRVTSVAFSSNGWSLVSASRDYTLRLWDLKDGKSPKVLEGHTSAVTSVTFSLDGQLLVLGSEDKTVRLWDPKNGKTLQVLQGHTSNVISVALSSDNRCLASMASKIRIWDPKTGRLMRTLKGGASSHSSPYFSLDNHSSLYFSLDDRWLLSTSNAEEVKLWDPEDDENDQSWYFNRRSKSFNSDGLTFNTDFGIIKLTEESLREHSNSVHHFKSIGLSIDRRKDWVSWNGKNVLWLPPEFRPDYFATVKQCIAIGYQSGLLYVLNFRSGVSLLDMN